MIDNDAYSAMQSNEAPNFPQYLYLDWEETQTFDTFIMKAAYGKGQAPTNWELEVSADGETGWVPVAASGDVNWNGNDWHVENQILLSRRHRGNRCESRSTAANLQWNHYAINEILVKDSSASPLMPILPLKAHRNGTVKMVAF